MARSGDEGVWLGLVALVIGTAAIGALSTSLNRTGRRTDFDDDDLDDEWNGDYDGEAGELPPGRELELEVLEEAEDNYPLSYDVLDNPRLRSPNGSIQRPDTLVVDENKDPVAIYEAKDVAVLRSQHVFQVANYDQTWWPRDGSKLRVRDRTYIPDEVRQLAEALDIELIEKE